MKTKIVEDGYITAIGDDFRGGTEISESEFDEILAAINSLPPASDRYGYRLNEDLTVEIYELPIEEEEFYE